MTFDFEALQERFGTELEERLGALAPRETLIRDASRYHFRTGGKRLRAYMPLWVCAQLGGEPENALPVGLGIEVLHNATLVHDDLQDGDRMRRGSDAVWARYGAAQAINVGNAMFFMGLQEIGRTAYSERLYGPTCQTMLAVVAGQALEFQLQLPRGHAHFVAPTTASWDSMARGKTAALFELCVFAGAIVAGRSSEDAMTLGAFGAATGQLFQLQDDYLDLVGDKGRDQPATDIAEGKISYPVAWAIEHGETALATELEAIVRRPRDATDATMVRRGLVLLRESGALDATAARLNTLAQEARQGPLGEAAQPLIQRILAPIAHAL